MHAVGASKINTAHSPIDTNSLTITHKHICELVSHSLVLIHAIREYTCSDSPMLPPKHIYVLLHLHEFTRMSHSQRRVQEQGAGRLLMVLDFDCTVSYSSKTCMNAAKYILHRMWFSLVTNPSVSQNRDVMYVQFDGQKLHALHETQVPSFYV